MLCRKLHKEYYDFYWPATILKGRAHVRRPSGFRMRGLGLGQKALKEPSRLKVKGKDPCERQCLQFAPSRVANPSDLKVTRLNERQTLHFAHPRLSNPYVFKSKTLCKLQVGHNVVKFIALNGV